MHVIGCDACSAAGARTFGRYEPMADDVGFWYWVLDDPGDANAEEGTAVWVLSTSPALAHARIRCSGARAHNGAQLANALNRAYGAKHAPVFDEDTGEAEPWDVHGTDTTTG